MKAMHIAVAGPIAGDDVGSFLTVGARPPRGYVGAPLTAILIGELLRLGHRVTAITTDSSLPISHGAVRCEGPNFTFVVCPARARAWRRNGALPGRILDLFAHERRSIAEVMRQALPDIVHAHWTYEFALAALDQPAPHVITCHDAPSAVLLFTLSPYRALRWWMARDVLRRGTAFTAVSEAMAKSLAPALGNAPQVVPNPVAPRLLALGRSRTLGTSRRVAMVCNGWDRLKNPKPALAGFAKWRRQVPSAELHVFGADFGSGEKAQQWAMAHHVDAGIHFHGSLPHRQLIEALAGMDVLLHPSLQESFGVVLAEAMALGLPVVAGLASGAVPWVLGADQQGRSACAALVDVRDADAICTGLISAFDGDYPARSHAGRLRAAEHFSVESVASTYLQRYASVLDRSRQPTSAPSLC